MTSKSTQPGRGRPGEHTFHRALPNPTVNRSRWAKRFAKAAPADVTVIQLQLQALHDRFSVRTAPAVTLREYLQGRLPAGVSYMGTEAWIRLMVEWDMVKVIDLDPTDLPELLVPLYEDADWQIYMQGRPTRRADGEPRLSGVWIWIASTRDNTVLKTRPQVTGETLHYLSIYLPPIKKAMPLLTRHLDQHGLFDGVSPKTNTILLHRLVKAAEGARLSANHDVHHIKGPASAEIFAFETFDARHHVLRVEDRAVHQQVLHGPASRTSHHYSEKRLAKAVRTLGQVVGMVSKMVEERPNFLTLQVGITLLTQIDAELRQLQAQAAGPLKSKGNQKGGVSMGKGGARKGSGRKRKPLQSQVPVDEDEIVLSLPPTLSAHILAKAMKQKVSFNEAVSNLLEDARRAEQAHEDREYEAHADN